MNEPPKTINIETQSVKDATDRLIDFITSSGIPMEVAAGACFVLNKTFEKDYGIRICGIYEGDKK